MTLKRKLLYGLAALLMNVGCLSADRKSFLYDNIYPDLSEGVQEVYDVQEDVQKDNYVPDNYIPDVVEDSPQEIGTDIGLDSILKCTLGGKTYEVGAIASKSCGLNGNGSIYQECRDSGWVVVQECIDPDTCLANNIEQKTCSKDLGLCKEGLETFKCLPQGENGAYILVSQNDCDGVKPLPEICGNGLDEDCDGVVDGAECMVEVPEGPFVMGCNPLKGLVCQGDDQFHTVTLSKYSLDKTEVTNAAYKECVTAGACTAPGNLSSYTHPDYYNNPEFGSFPVIYVTWYQADAFCTWAGKKLPTEAQWEKAARGTDERMFPWGNDAPTCDLTNYNLCTGDVAEVNLYPNGISPYQALQMAGNVGEWVADWYDGMYYFTSPLNDPKGPDVGQLKVFRGGGFKIKDLFISPLYSYFRNSTEKNVESESIGFRCAK